MLCNDLYYIHGWEAKTHLEPGKTISVTDENQAFAEVLRAVLAAWELLSLAAWERGSAPGAPPSSDGPAIKTWVFARVREFADDGNLIAALSADIDEVTDGLGRRRVRRIHLRGDGDRGLWADIGFNENNQPQSVRFGLFNDEPAQQPAAYAEAHMISVMCLAAALASCGAVGVEDRN